MNNRLLKRLILKEISSVLNEGKGELKDRDSRRFSDLIREAADNVEEAFSILEDNGIMGTLTDDVMDAKEQLNSLASQVSSKFGSGFNPYASAKDREL